MADSARRESARRSYLSFPPRVVACSIACQRGMHLCCRFQPLDRLITQNELAARNRFAPFPDLRAARSIRPRLRYARATLHTIGSARSRAIQRSMSARTAWLVRSDCEHRDQRQGVKRPRRQTDCGGAVSLPTEGLPGYRLDCSLPFGSPQPPQPTSGYAGEAVFPRCEPERKRRPCRRRDDRCRGHATVLRAIDTIRPAGDREETRW